MDEFKGLMAAETGIPAGIAENEVRIGADMLVEAASLTTQVGGEIIPSEHLGTLSLASAPDARPTVRRRSTSARRSSSTSTTTPWKTSAKSIWCSMSSAATSGSGPQA